MDKQRLNDIHFNSLAYIQYMRAKPRSRFKQMRFRSERKAMEALDLFGMPYLAMKENGILYFLYLNQLVK
jgi:hypothetical protein